MFLSCSLWLTYLPLHAWPLKETYGDTSSDSSDEDYGETVGPRRRKKSTGKAIPVPGSEPDTIHKGADIKDENCNQKYFEMTPVQKMNKKFEIVGSNNISVDSPRISTEGGSIGKRTGRPYQRLGDVVVQVLMCFVPVESSLNHSM